MIELMSFQDALQDSLQYKKRNLLLGNGFSIACKPDIFHYAALYEQADFSAAPEIEEVFKALKTHDFEVVIHALENASKILPIYLDDKSTAPQFQKHADLIKDLLVKTVAGNHPPNPSAVEEMQFWACRSFLSHFMSDKNDGRVYTLNYDLLIYWALMHDDNPFLDQPLELTANDGFGEDIDADNPDYVVWKAEKKADKQRVHYLHGALHLFDGGAELKKYTWNRAGIPLIEQVRAAIEKDMYPIFVSEGTNQQKLSKIRHHAYLQHSFKSFHTIMDSTDQTLFVYGHSLADNDAHILKKIGRGRIPCVYISLYGNPSEAWNKQIVANAEKLVSMRLQRFPLKVKYYDAGTTNVWGDKS